MKLTLQYWKTVIQIVWIGLALTVLLSIAMVNATKDKSKLEVLLYNTSATEAETGEIEYNEKRAEHDAISASQKELNAYFDNTFGPLRALYYRTVAGNHRMAERHWRNVTVKAYIYWWFWLIAGILSIMILRIVYGILDKKLPTAKESKNKGVKIAADSDGTLLPKEVMTVIFGIIGLMAFGAIIRVPIQLGFVGVAIAIFIKSLSFVSYGGKILPSREKIESESGRLADEFRGTFNIRKRQKPVGHLARRPQKQATGNKLAPPPSMDCLLGGGNDE